MRNPVSLSTMSEDSTFNDVLKGRTIESAALDKRSRHMHINLSSPMGEKIYLSISLGQNQGANGWDGFTVVGGWCGSCGETGGAQ
jgi:hypothetical protein